MRRVVITGLGTINSLGNDVASFWPRCLAGENGVGPITTFDAASFPVTFAGCVRWDPRAHFTEPELRKLDPFTMFTLVARPYTLRVGSLINYDSNLQGQLRNSLGTFTFTDLETYAAGLPSTFTQRRGAQPLTVAVTQAAGFVQTEFVKWRWNFGAGLRYEAQSGVGDPGARWRGWPHWRPMRLPGRLSRRWGT